MSVFCACLIKRVSKLPLYQLVIILSPADVLCKQFGRPPVKYFTDRSKAVLLICFFCLSFAMPLCTSVYVCLVVTCWEKADLLALVCGSGCEFVTFPLVSWVRWYLIVSIPDLCTRTYFNTGVASAQDEKCL